MNGSYLASASSPPLQADGTFRVVYIPTFRVSSVGNSIARAPLFPNLGRTWGGSSMFHILPPLLRSLTSIKLSCLASCPPISVRFVSVAKYSHRCGTSNWSGSKIFLAQRCPLISLIWLLLYHVGFLDIPGCCFQQRNVYLADCIQISVYPSCGFPT